MRNNSVDASLKSYQQSRWMQFVSLRLGLIAGSLVEPYLYRAREKLIEYLIVTFDYSIQWTTSRFQYSSSNSTCMPYNSSNSISSSSSRIISTSNSNNMHSSNNSWCSKGTRTKRYSFSSSSSSSNNNNRWFRCRCCKQRKPHLAFRSLTNKFSSSSCSSNHSNNSNSFRSDFKLRITSNNQLSSFRQYQFTRNLLRRSPVRRISLNPSFFFLLSLSLSLYLSQKPSLTRLAYRCWENSSAFQQQRVDIKFSSKRTTAAAATVVALALTSLVDELGKWKYAKFNEHSCYCWHSYSSSKR